MSKTLYVSNLGQTINLAELEDLFTMVGDVASTKLLMVPESSIHEFGVVEMGNEQQAQDCVERFNGHAMNGQALSVRSSYPKAPAPRVVKAPVRSKARKSRRAL